MTVPTRGGHLPEGLEDYHFFCSLCQDVGDESSERQTSATVEDERRTSGSRLNGWRTAGARWRGGWRADWNDGLGLGISLRLADGDGRVARLGGIRWARSWGRGRDPGAGSHWRSWGRRAGNWRSRRSGWSRGRSLDLSITNLRDGFVGRASKGASEGHDSNGEDGATHVCG
jgi:hypothetical protein